MKMSVRILYVLFGLCLILAAGSFYLVYTQTQEQAVMGKQLAENIQTECQKNPRRIIPIAGNTCEQATTVAESPPPQELPGTQGENGAKGDKGDPGIPGQKGERGEQGIQGIPGPPGADGIPGENGKDGRDGVDGVDGKDGRDGIPGQGIAGPAGSSCSEGFIRQLREVDSDGNSLTEPETWEVCVADGGG